MRPFRRLKRRSTLLAPATGTSWLKRSKRGCDCTAKEAVDEHRRRQSKILLAMPAATEQNRWRNASYLPDPPRFDLAGAPGRDCGDRDACGPASAGSSVGAGS